MTHRTAAASQDVARKIAVAAAAALGLLVAAGPATGPLATALAVEPGSVQTPGPNGQPYPAVPANGPYPNAPAGQPYPTPPATDGTGAPVASPDLVPAGPTAAPQPMVPTQGGATSTAGPVSGPMSGPISGPMSGAMSGPATRPAGVAAPAGDPVIRVSAGRSVIVRLPRLGQQTQSVDPGVAGVAMQPEPSDGRSMVVTGRKGGTTTLLVLDEPTEGLDLHGRELVREVARERRAAGKTVLLVSHSAPEVEALCDEVAVIVGGKLAHRSTLDQLKGESGPLEGALKTVYAKGAA